MTKLDRQEIVRACDHFAEMSSRIAVRLPVRALGPTIGRNMEEAEMGPLAGVKIVEFTGIGPAPMAAMMLADMGATIIRIDRTGPADVGIPMPDKFDFT